jgi:hypothetical protein
LHVIYSSILIYTTVSSYATKSIHLKNYRGPLFKGIQLGDYRLIKKFEGLKTATELPESIRKLMGETGTVIRTGSYRPLEN